ncbi:hypothetical protein ABT300_08930 [Streptomyces sp. NPDC001027]|uniref:hypothetical protein n=1 Tax=Streptomyces sp. NPDC001027 TaxID=3154771 RepID=UPI00331771BD
MREGSHNEQLRYALRSWVANLPHRRVWVVGFRPWWAVGVGHIPTDQRLTPAYVNTTTAMRAACEHPEVSDPFLWANDDFFVMRPQEAPFPVFHRGPVREVFAQYGTRSSAYVAAMRETHAFLVGLGHEEPTSFELHVPLPVRKDGMLHALDVGEGHDVHKRTVYGAVNGVTGIQMRDVKIARRGPQFDAASAFLSTMPDSFHNGAVGRHIRGAFPDPCPYEGRRTR